MTCPSFRNQIVLPQKSVVAVGAITKSFEFQNIIHSLACPAAKESGFHIARRISVGNKEAKEVRNN